MTHFTLQLNARLRPLDRGDIYEDPLHEILEKRGLGETSGGGTGMAENEEVDYCDVELILKDNNPETLIEMKAIIEAIGVPKGSFLQGKNYKEPVGRLEELALYVNGTELHDEVYEKCDINHVIETICELIDGKSEFYSYNEHLSDTALYFYGDSFQEMADLIASFLHEYPLCEKSRVIQIS